jgi:hypothetical protein
MLDFEFSNAFVLCKAILNPNPMKDILRDLDTSADTVVIMFTPNYLSFYTVGVLGKIKVCRKALRNWIWSAFRWRFPQPRTSWSS